MAFNLDSIKRGLKLGGARPNLFEVSFTTPVGVAGTNLNTVNLLVQAASIPSSDLGVIGVPYFGRILKLAGDRTFAPWSVTIMNDEDFKIRDGLEKWSEAINGLQSNLRTEAMGAHNYKGTDAIVKQFGKTGKVIRTYKFHGIFPSSIGSIGLNWADNDSIETFQVEFQYDHWSVVGGIGSENNIVS